MLMRIVWVKGERKCFGNLSHRSNSVASSRLVTKNLLKLCTRFDAKITAETRVEENVRVMTGGSVVEVMVTLVPEKHSMLLEFILTNMSRPASRSSKKLLSSLVFGIPESKT